MLLTVSIILFAIAALGGLTLAAMRLANRPLPLGLALVHGAFAATALVLLIIAMIIAGKSTALLNAALILFIIAAIGGFILFSFHLRSKSLPIPLMLLHGLVAVVAFILLLVQVLA